MPTRPHLTKKTKIWMIQTTQPPRDTPLVIFRVRQMFGWIGSQGETKRDGGIERSHNHSRTTTHNPTGLLSYCTSHESLPPQVTRHDALLTVEGPSTRTLQLISCRVNQHSRCARVSTNQIRSPSFTGVRYPISLPYPHAVRTAIDPHHPSNRSIRQCLSQTGSLVGLYLAVRAPGAGSQFLSPA
jgi:hypothetical protein